jgi:hypothetical protein
LLPRLGIEGEDALIRALLDVAGIVDHGAVL